MTIWIDQPIWPRHGTVFAHLISDTSLDELHAFAHRVGLHPRSFEGDHYDVPQERYALVVSAGATSTTGADVVRRLIGAGCGCASGAGTGRWPAYPPWSSPTAPTPPWTSSPRTPR